MSSAESNAQPIDEELRRFVRTIRNRNLREWIACAVVAPAFLLIAVMGKGLLHTFAASEVVLAAAYVAWRLHRDGRVSVADTDAGSSERAREVLVREMRRQAALLERAGWWYVAPLAAGWLGLQLASMLARPPRPGDVAYVVAGIGLGIVIVLMNRHAAKKLRKRADELA